MMNCKKSPLRWEQGPLIAGVPPVLANFSSVDDKELVWRCLKDGCRTTSVVVTQDSNTRMKKEGEMKKRRKKSKSSYHAKCFDSEALASCQDDDHQHSDSETNKKDDVVWLAIKIED